MKTRIAVNQARTMSNSPLLNFESMQRIVEKNAADGALLSIFPEDFIFGVLRNHEDLLAAANQFDQWVKRFCELAQRYSIELIPGSLPRYKAGKIYNSSVYINSEGRVLQEYAKRNLWLSERRSYSSFNKNSGVVDGALGKTSVIICWDLFDHRLFEEAVKSGAQWVVCIAFWSVNQSKDLASTRGASKRKYHRKDTAALDAIIRSRVVEYNIGLIFCNYADKHPYEGWTGSQEAVTAGRTQVITPGYEQLGRCANRKEKTLLCDVPDITNEIADLEMYYGRREDIIDGYPFAQTM